MAKQLFEITVKQPKYKKIAQKVQKFLNKKHNQLSRRGPSIMRNALSETLSKDPRLNKYANLVSNLPAESRVHTNPKIGSGVMMRISGGKIHMRIRISPRALQSKDAYYSLMTAQYGRSAIRPKKSKVLALAVRQVENGQKSIPHLTKPGRYVVFSKYAGPVAPYSMWMDDAKKLAVKKMIQYIERK